MKAMARLPVERVAPMMIGLLPWMFACTAVVLRNPDLHTRWRMDAWDYASCFAQPFLAWSLLFVLGSLFRRQGGRLTWVVLTLCNVVAILHLLDARCKYVLYQPLSVGLLLDSLHESASLASSAGLFFSAPFVAGALVSLLCLQLFAFLPLVERWRWRWPEEAWRWRAASCMSACLACVFVWLSRSQPYHLDDSTLVADVASVLRRAPQKGAREHAVANQCDQALYPSRPSGVALSGALAGRNVVLFIAESWAYDQTSLARAELDTTPFAAALADHALAAGSVRAQTAFSTKAIYALLTGRYAAASLEAVESLQARVGSLASALVDEGYETAFFSAQGLGWQNTGRQYRSMGFQRVLGAEALRDQARAEGRTVHANSWGVADEELLQGLVATLPTDKPFFAVFYNASTHMPYHVPGNDREDYSLAQYRRALRYSDQVLAGLVRQLRERGSWHNTLFLLAGDHGENFVDGYFAPRGCGLTESELNAAFIMMAPGLGPDQGAGIDMAGARHIDVVPTVLDLLGIRASVHVQGRSLLSAVDAIPPAYIWSYGTCDVSGEVRGRRKTVLDHASGRAHEVLLAGGPVGAGPATDSAEALQRVTACAAYNELAVRNELPGAARAHPVR